MPGSATTSNWQWLVGVRSAAVAQKIALHLARFRDFFIESYGHERIATCLRRDVHAWQQCLIDAGLAAATINNHLASLSACTTWIHAQAPHLFPAGDPARGSATCRCRHWSRGRSTSTRSGHSRTSVIAWSASTD